MSKITLTGMEFDELAQDYIKLKDNTWLVEIGLLGIDVTTYGLMVEIKDGKISISPVDEEDFDAIIDEQDWEL
jgi:hypothetical protein